MLQTGSGLTLEQITVNKKKLRKNESCQRKKMLNDIGNINTCNYITLEYNHSLTLFCQGLLHKGAVTISFTQTGGMIRHVLVMDTEILILAGSRFLYVHVEYM